MELEEAKIFPKALELLDEKDWAEIEACWNAVEEPVFGPAVAEVTATSMRASIGGVHHDTHRERSRRASLF